MSFYIIIILIITHISHIYIYIYSPPPHKRFLGLHGVRVYCHVTEGLLMSIAIPQ